jgi:superfamily II DNA or RNA helicase
MVIYDECHHNGAEVFSKSMMKMTIPITLGLSATLNRKDGLRKVFEWYLGDPVFESKKRDDTDVIVKVVRYTSDDPEYSRERYMWNGKRNSALMLNCICAHAPRNEVLIDALEAVLKQESGRKTIILSDRRKHLTELAKIIGDRRLGSFGYYVGGMKQDDLKASESKDIILGTYTLVSEGFDVPALNTLVFASPITSIEQSVGRIQRQKPCDRKFTPLIIDLWDDFSLYKNQHFTRRKFYKKNGYKIESTNNEGCGSDDDNNSDGECKLKQKAKVEFIDDED